MYAIVEAKEKSIAASKKSKALGDQYADLSAKLKELKAQLKDEMKVNEKIIADFAKISK